MTATFDHRETGTPEHQWLDGGLDGLDRMNASDGTLIVLAAHPDDETLGAGGLIAASAALGAEIDVVVASDGDASHPASTTHPPGALAALRRHEVAAAVAGLAPRARIHPIGLPDGALGDYEDELLRRVESLPRQGSVRIVTPWLGDRHPDHEACARVGERFARVTGAEHLQYPIWAWHWARADTDDLPRQRLIRFELSPSELTAKRTALAEHVSQHSALSDLEGDEPILPPDVLAHFTRPFECFVGAAPAARADYFATLYEQNQDPWGLADRFYEQRKRSILLASLPRRRFKRVFEPGCANGQLTSQLVDRADELVAWDGAEAAVARARDSLAGAGHRVEVERRRIPHEWPSGSFDLVVLSEVGYYCEDLALLVRRTLEALRPDGVVAACHWTRAAPDHPQTGEAVHAAFDRSLVRVVHHREDDFRLDVWTRDGRSVATDEGIV